MEILVIGRKAVPALSKAYIALICREKELTIFKIWVKGKICEEKKFLKQGLIHFLSFIK